MKSIKCAWLLGVATLACVTTGSAVAGPVITDWNYTVSAAFDTASPTFSNSSGCNSISGSLLSWGSCTSNLSPIGNPSRSGLGIVNSNATGVIQTNGAAGIANTYVHYNNTATTGTLQTAIVQSSLTLSSLAPVAGLDFGPATLPYFIQFVETANNVPLSTCVVTDSTRPCADIFVITGVLENTFSLDGNTYKVSFFAPTEDLYTLSDEVCAAANAASGCTGFTTQERETNAFTFNFTITNVAAEVPEPSSLALMGLGLAAALGARQKRRARSDRVES
ncbi:THxN family PEP-CTERM protein [Variovorax sp. HJSM1_2]|uniref:THxN family PEP-CTERM protein n=1 Tax=Variovorax sp. HJSM1_2 TaxID=3366263 RepID=UPI003BCBFB3B